jgi:carbon-monoxide dehydrogenase medium subunit
MWTKFDYVKASTMTDAFKILNKYKGEVAVYAGGSDLLLGMRGEGPKPKILLDIKGLEGLSKLSYKNKTLSIGANVTVSQLMKTKPAVKAFELFQEVGSLFGSPPIRNQATIGGNICRASPSSDMAPCLMVLDALVVVAAKGKQRKIDIKKFFKAPKETVLKMSELVVALEIPAPTSKTGTAFDKLRRTNFDLAIVNAAASVSLKRKKVASVRVALGGVAPTPIRATNAEKLLLNQEPTEELLKKAGQAAAAQTKPISDVRASAEYRRHVSKILVERVLENALHKIGGAAWK